MNTSIVIVSKDEPELDRTLDCLENQYLTQLSEIVVIDSSSGRLDSIRAKHPIAKWHDFKPREGRSTSIPHQRNFGVDKACGDVVVFLDAGCVPRPGWLKSLLQPIVEDGELMATGLM